MKKVLFVCLGNICRSPMGEGMMKHQINNKGLSKDYFIDSAGTSAYHVGEMADARMRKTAEGHGVVLTSRSRQVQPSDFEDFDIILAMDESNYRDLIQLAEENNQSADNVKLMREFDQEKNDINVPDPYYGGDAGFEEVYSIMERSCHELILSLEA